MGRLTPGAGVLGRKGGAHGQEGPGRNETERRGRRPEVKEHLKPPGAGRDRRDLPLNLQREVGPAHALISDF